MSLRFYFIKLLSFLSLAICLSLSAAEIPNELAAKRSEALRVMCDQGGYTPELLLPRLSFYVALLCNRDNKEGRVIAENADMGAVALSPNGNYCAFILANDRTSIQVYDTRTGTLVHSLHGHTNYISCLVFSPNNQFLFSGADDSTVCVWDFIADKLVRQHVFPERFRRPNFYKFSTDCHSILLNPNTRGPIAAPVLGDVYWNLDSNKLITTCDLNCSCAGCPMDFASDDRLVFIDKNSIYLWDIVNKCEICTSQVRTFHRECAFCDNFVAISCYDTWPYSRIDVWDIHKKQFLKSISLQSVSPGHWKDPYRLLFSADGSFLAIAYEDKNVDIYDVRTRSCLLELSSGPLYPDCPLRMSFDCCGQIATIGFDGKVRLFNSLPIKIRQALHSLSLNQLLILMEIVPALAQGHVIHLTPRSRAWNLVNRMPPEIKTLVEQCIRLSRWQHICSFLP